jgi:hypothetical protein
MPKNNDEKCSLQEMFGAVAPCKRWLECPNGETWQNQNHYFHSVAKRPSLKTVCGH